VLEQLRGQGDLAGRFDPQPGLPDQFDDQSVVSGKQGASSRRSAREATVVR
jgi:hypothetical protein